MRCRPTGAAIATLTLLFVTSCRTPEDVRRSGAPQTDPEGFDLRGACAVIERRNAEFTDAHVAGDVAAIDAMFTPDAKSFPPGAEAVTGLAALHAFTVEYLSAGVKEFRERTTDCYGNGELLVDQGEYVVTYGPDDTVERGKYLNVWKPVDGTWKIHANIWNTSPAAVTAPD